MKSLRSEIICGGEGLKYNQDYCCAHGLSMYDLVGRCVCRDVWDKVSDQLQDAKFDFSAVEQEIRHGKY